MQQQLTYLLRDHPELDACIPSASAALAQLITSVSAGNKVLTCGNGGSAADSEHIVGELMKGFLSKRPVSDDFRWKLRNAYDEAGDFLADHLQGTIPAISLVSQSALITAFLNDVEPSMIFAQQVLGYGQSGDCLIALSTSGNSTNVVNAVRVGKILGVHTIGMTGTDGGMLRDLCDFCICAPAKETARVQEYHQMIYHALCAALEAVIFSE